MPSRNPIQLHLVNPSLRITYTPNPHPHIQRPARTRLLRAALEHGHRALQPMSALFNGKLSMAPVQDAQHILIFSLSFLLLSPFCCLRSPFSFPPFALFGLASPSTSPGALRLLTWLRLRYRMASVVAGSQGTPDLKQPLHKGEPVHAS